MTFRGVKSVGDMILGGIVALALLIYLAYTLLKAEEL
ncbi:potassium-transporting ATPase subunit F [Acididesulfobacillus acetoxydans]|nr:potassium-transporting ATPase subunit F [Acididesulfobacillus acetoxydans]